MAKEETLLEPSPNPEAETAIQAAFERATADKRPKKAEIKPIEQTKSAESKPAEKTQEKPPEAEVKPVTELKLPSFITGDKKEEKPPETEVKLEDLPKEAPEGATEKQKIDWRKTRKLLESQDTELKSLREKQVEKEEKGKQLSQADADRLQQLEAENNQQRDQLQRLGLQQHPRFLQEVIQPLQSTYVEAKRIIQEAGGNPQALDRALTATGKAHYDAMDEILAELPESAKGELNSAMRDYRRLVQTRNSTLANAPKAFQELQKQDAINQKQVLESQRGEMESLFETTVKNLRDNNKFELLLKTDDKDSQWWNAIPDKVVKTAKSLFLENQDMGTVAEACVLAASAGTMRELWLKAEERAQKAEKELSDVRGAEPTIGDTPIISSNGEVDLNEPFGKTFLKQLKSQSSEK